MKWKLYKEGNLFYFLISLEEKEKQLFKPYLQNYIFSKNFFFFLPRKKKEQGRRVKEYISILGT